jgi:beta-mannanase
MPVLFATATALLLPLVSLVIAGPAAASAVTYEAETGLLNGVTVGATTPGYSGTGYVEGFDTGTDSVTITIPDSPGGLYDLSVRYAAPYGSKVASLQLNGSGHGDVSLAATPDFTTVSAGQVLLASGDNTIGVVNNWGWYLIDALVLTPSAPPPAHQVTDALVNPGATAATRSLMRYLAAHYGNSMLSGQQDYADIEWLQQQVGKRPAIAGLDLMDYSPSRVERGTTSQEIEHALDWDTRGGITTLTWHWNAPTGLIDQPGREWWRGFYTDATTFDVAAALADPASAEYALLLRDIDAIAVQLQRLEDANVPVLWRPLHEAEGGWFWWGAKGAGPAKQLWRLMYDRLTDLHGLDNLIWVWNSASPDWYPGADVVDILSVDTYPPVGDHGPIIGKYQDLVTLGQDRKLVALTETGSIPEPDLLQAYRADWSWFVTWSGDFIRDGQRNPLDLLQRVYHHPYVITLDEVGDFKNYTGTSPSPSPSASPSASPSPSVSPSASPSPSTPPPGGCSATYRVTNQWPGGFQGEVVVTNTGSTAISGWTVTWSLAAGQGVTQNWSSVITVTGSQLKAVNAGWNGALAPGSSTAFGFLGTYSGANPVPAPISCAR